MARTHVWAGNYEDTQYQVLWGGNLLEFKTDDKDAAKQVYDALVASGEQDVTLYRLTITETSEVMENTGD